MKMEELINKHADHLNWMNLSKRIDINQIDEQLFDNYQYFWEWSLISKYQILSEDFIRKWKTYVDWVNISIHQLYQRVLLENLKTVLIGFG